MMSNRPSLPKNSKLIVERSPEKMTIKFSCFDAIDRQRYQEPKFWLMLSCLLPLYLFITAIILACVLGLGFFTFVFVLSIPESMGNILALLAMALIIVVGWALIALVFYGFTAIIMYRLFGHTVITVDRDFYSFELRISKFKAGTKGITKNIRSVEAREGYTTTTHNYYVACLIKEEKISKHELIGLNYAEAKWIAAEILDYIDSIAKTESKLN